MGQATLAFRNLLVRAAIFVVLAAALAWFVGGTLFGKHRVNFPAISWDGREWAAQVIGNGTRPDEVRWRLLSKLGEEPWTVMPISETGQWRQLDGPHIDAQGLWIRVAENASSTSPEWSYIRFANANAEPTKSLVRFVISTAQSTSVNGSVPPPLSDDALNAMTFEEAQTALGQVAIARNSAGLDDTTRTRLKVDFDRLKNYMKGKK